MKISKAHQKFSEYLQKTDALENPQNYLGPNYLSVLNFWLYLDNLSKEQMEKCSKIHRSMELIDLPEATIVGSYNAWNSTHIFLGIAAADATYELINLESLLQNGYTVKYIPLFDNL